MGNRLGLLAAAILLGVCAGGCCCNDRVWRCPDGQCGILSGRFDDCSPCTHCDACGELLGKCRCSPWAAFKRRITCGEGCGEVYWDEWRSDPPAPCDPCDEHCGNFVGRRCCPPPWRCRTSALLLGRRCCTWNCDGRCGDENCGRAGCADGSCTTAADPIELAPAGAQR